MSKRPRTRRRTAAKAQGLRRDPHRIARVGVVRMPAGSVVAVDVVRTTHEQFGVGLNYGDGVPLPSDDFDTAESAIEEGHRILSELRLLGATDASEKDLPPPTPRSTHVQWTVEVNEPHLLALGLKRRYVGRRFRDR